MDSIPSRRNDNRVIVHFDYDCFYASVFEHENPALKDLPLAVQQKQIIVTCNYEARRRGLRKLQLISDARRICPDVVIVLGEELGRFRDASKTLYNFLQSYTWGGKVERLGFDEVFMDVTDIVDYNQALLNPNGLTRSFFQLKKDDPTIGFEFDASWIAPHGYPPDIQPSTGMPTHQDTLTARLILGSHLAQYLRMSLEEHKGYTATVGISTNKLISKLVGNLNKPRGQTTLLPPYTVGSGYGSNDVESEPESNVTRFLDGHEIGKIPGIGFKMAQRIRNHVLSRAASHGMESTHEWTKDLVTVRYVRLFPGMGAKTLEQVLGGPGMERDIGSKVWSLINGVDDTEVQKMRRVPTQISIEDSYIRLDVMPQVLKEMRILATSLVNRMHTDLLEDDQDPESNNGLQRWMAYPKTVRLSTRPRLPLNADGTRTRSFSRISRSMPLPAFVFNLRDDVAVVVERLVQEALVPMFRRLHPQTKWNLSLMNVCVTNLVEAASEDSGSSGRDIGKMFKRQETTLKEWKVEDKDIPPDLGPEEEPLDRAEPSAGNDAMEIIEGSEDMLCSTQDTVDDARWEDDDQESESLERCGQCGASLPGFAMPAHERFHNLEE